MLGHAHVIGILDLIYILLILLYINNILSTEVVQNDQYLLLFLCHKKLYRLTCVTCPTFATFLYFFHFFSSENSYYQGWESSGLIRIS